MPINLLSSSFILLFKVCMTKIDYFFFINQSYLITQIIYISPLGIILFIFKQTCRRRIFNKKKKKLSLIRRCSRGASVKNNQLKSSPKYNIYIFQLYLEKRTTQTKPKKNNNNQRYKMENNNKRENQMTGD